MLEELYMQDLANSMKMTPEPIPAGKVTVSAPEPEMAGMEKAYVGTRLNVPKPGQPTPEDREKMAVGLLDTLAGALRGAAAQTMGLPGDIRSILDMINQEGAEKYLGQRSFATTEEILKDTSVRVPGTNINVPFPPVLKEGVPNREERQKAVDVAQEVGTFLPAPGAPEAAIQGVKAVGKAIKAIKNMPVGNSIKDASGAEMVIPKAPKVESKAFKNWFGDSKAVDDTGKPIVVYHATRGQFDEFNTTGEGQSLNTGTFFSSSPDVAGTYNTSSQHSIVPAYLSLKNPVVVDANGANWNKIGQDAKISLPKIKVSAKEDEMLLSELTGQKPNMGAMTTLEKRDTTAKELFGETVFEKGFSTNEIARWARSKGYDGVIFKNVVDHGPAMRFSTEQAEKPSNIYVAFQPTQIKSAISNKGEFSPTNPNMLLGAGGATVAATQEENK